MSYLLRPLITELRLGVFYILSALAALGRDIRELEAIRKLRQEYLDATQAIDKGE